jgi:hypothetical protein
MENIKIQYKVARLYNERKNNTPTVKQNSNIILSIEFVAVTAHEFNRSQSLPCYTLRK